ncbi:hypothetical protein BHM03_00039029 [Ensete ventricosum]|nr:hypothetical protein BHM03_00039029 [Ensete ventricosum]
MSRTGPFGTLSASDGMQDFKTGYLTLASPTVIDGTAMRCVIAPSVFWLFLKAFKDIGTRPGNRAPITQCSLVYRNMAILGVEGFSSLPKHCLFLCYVFFLAAVLVKRIKGRRGEEGGEVHTTADGHSDTILLGVRLCHRVDKAKAEAFGPAVAAGLICGIRDMDSSAVGARAGQGEAAHMHEVFVEENERDGGCVHRIRPSSSVRRLSSSIRSDSSSVFILENVTKRFALGNNDDIVFRDCFGSRIPHSRQDRVEGQRNIIRQQKRAALPPHDWAEEVFIGTPKRTAHMGLVGLTVPHRLWRSVWFADLTVQIDRAHENVVGEDSGPTWSHEGHETRVRGEDSPVRQRVAPRRGTWRLAANESLPRRSRG